MSSGTILLYYLCFVLSLGLAGFVLRRAPKRWLNRIFALAALSLFAWLYTLYLYDQTASSDSLSVLGRANYAAVLLAGLLGYLFVRELTGKRVTSSTLFLMLAETAALAVITLATPLVDRRELLAATGRSTQFGPLFALFVIHVVGYLGAAVVFALRARAGTRDARLREQLALIGLGMLVSAGIGIEADIVLPFAFHDFVYQNVGAFAAVLYFASIAYSITALRLFDVRLVIKRAFILSGVVALGMEVYEAMIDSLARLLPTYNTTDQKFLATLFVLLLNAFTQDSIRQRLSTAFDGRRKTAPKEASARRDRP